MTQLAMTAQRIQLLITGARQVVTCAGFSESPARGPGLSDAGIVPGAAVAIDAGRVLAVGERADIEARFEAEQVLDASGKTVCPGFVDPHTHLLFAGERIDEWLERLAGKTYLEILQAGGGILNTVLRTRAASEPDLVAHGRYWLREFLRHGTTTIEAKTGYCLDFEGEMKLLRVLSELAPISPIRIVPTLLAAHVVPPEYRNDRAGYLELVERLHVEARRLGLAENVDVFCEREAFTLEETRRLLDHARRLGFGLKLHGEQFTNLGAASLAAELNAVSIDHLEHVDRRGMAALAAAQVPAVLLPGASFHLGSKAVAPARELIEAGVPIALATDFNPGTSPTPSMLAIQALACRLYRLTPHEAIMASTINAAHALGLGAQCGSIEPGKCADLVVYDTDDVRWLSYAFGYEPMTQVVIGGEIVFDASVAAPHR